ncbi:unnamed protein product [Leptidea sinapis]|uniref:Uncharacterized protein n=1 Tax=Leptidea sinapis TaxID=189913 RepID=A0A5E4QN56_9NEOP|nr:unnamed protein product [Leptidea sinapis]
MSLQRHEGKILNSLPYNMKRDVALEVHMSTLSKRPCCETWCSSCDPYPSCLATWWCGAETSATRCTSSRPASVSKRRF